MSININVFLRNSLFILMALYFAQGPFYPTGSILGKMSLLALLLISSYFLLRSIRLNDSKSLLFYSVVLLLVTNFFGFLIIGSYTGTYFSQIRNILTALLPFFSFYYLTKKGYLEEKHLVRFFILMLPIAIAVFYHTKSTVLLSLAIGSENVVNNTAYLFVSLIPFVFFLSKKKILSVIGLLILVFFIIQGAKRGALVTAAIGVIVFAYYQFINTPPNKRRQGYVIALVGLCFMVAFTVHFIESNEFLIHRMQEIPKGASGRDIIYTNLLMAWYNSDSILNYVFGFGFVATIQKSGAGNLAHNDWLELLINFGLFGVVIYLILFLSIARYVLNPIIPKTYRLVMLAVAGMWFLQTLFSMYYTASSTAITMVVLGYLVGIKSMGSNQQSKRVEVLNKYG